VKSAHFFGRKDILFLGIYQRCIVRNLVISNFIKFTIDNTRSNIFLYEIATIEIDLRVKIYINTDGFHANLPTD